MPTKTTKAASRPAASKAARPRGVPAKRAPAKGTKAAPAPAPAPAPASAPAASSRHAENAAKVLRRFRIIFNAVKNHFRAVEKQAGISGAQLWALSVIHANPGAGMNQLANAMDLHQSTASNLVRALVESGLAVSAREGADRRAVQLYLTAEGHKALARAPGPFSGVLPEALLHLDEPTLARLERDLARVIQRIGPQGHGRNVPLGS